MLSNQKPNPENILISRDMENRQEVEDAVKEYGRKRDAAYDMESLATHTAGVIGYGLFTLKLEGPDLTHWLKHKIWAALQEQQRKNYAMQVARENLR